jgi:hypothetical protein
VFSTDELKNLQQLLGRLVMGNESASSGSEKEQSKNNKGHKQKRSNCGNNGNNDGQGKNKNNCPKLDPGQLLIIAGLLSGALSVRSVLVNSDQVVEFVLTGTLKRKTNLEKVMKQVGQMPFDQVIRAIMENNL